MNKRIISVFIIIAITLSFMISNTIVFAANESINLLASLQIGDFKEEDTAVTRGQFASAVSDILNYNMRPGVARGNFSDVSESSVYSGGVYEIYKRGIISGYNDTYFGIDEAIKYEHAVKIIVSALGYDILAKNQGGYPSGYMTVASQRGILKGVNKRGGDTLSGAEAAKLIENMINCEPLIQSLYGGEERYEAKEGESMLYVYAGIRKIEGILSDNGKTSLTGESATYDGNVIIDGLVCKEGETKAGELIGHKVLAYVKEEGDDLKVLYIGKGKNINTLEIPASRLWCDDTRFSSECIVYEDVYGNEAFANIEKGADFIFNGKAYVDLTTENLKIDGGKLLLVDNNFDKIFDVVIIKSVKNYIVNAVDEEEKIIYAKDGNIISAEKSNNLNIIIDGREGTLSEIKQWDIAGVEKSIDSKFITVNISTQRLTGEVESIERGGVTVLVDGQYYHVSNESVLEKIYVGGSFEFCIDSDGAIFALKGESTKSKSVGIVIDAGISSGVEKKAQVRIFTDDGKHEIFNISDNANINESTADTREGKVEYIKNNTKGKIVSFKLNSDGLVEEIMLPSENESGLREDFIATEEQTYASGQKNFSGKVIMDDKTVVFSVPEDMSQYDKYAVTDASCFVHNEKYLLSAYSFGADDGVSDYIIYSDSGKTFRTSNHPILVTKITTAVDDDGEVYEYVYGFDYNNEVKIRAKEGNIFTDAKIKEGDIIRCSTDSTGAAIAVSVVVDSSSAKLINGVGSSYNSSPRYVVCDVYYRWGDILGCTTYDLSKSFNKKDVEDSIEKHVLRGAKIYVFDRDKSDDKVKAGTAQQIYDYTSLPEKYSRIFLYTYSGTLRMAVVYNR